MSQHDQDEERYHQEAARREASPRGYEHSSAHSPNKAFNEMMFPDEFLVDVVVTNHAKAAALALQHEARLDRIHAIIQYFLDDYADRKLEKSLGAKLVG